MYLYFDDAFSQSMSAFVAQNFGARKMDRAKRGMAYGMAVSFGVGLILFYFIGYFNGCGRTTFVMLQVSWAHLPSGSPYPTL